MSGAQKYDPAKDRFGITAAGHIKRLTDQADAARGRRDSAPLPGIAKQLRHWAGICQRNKWTRMANRATHRAEQLEKLTRGEAA